MLLMQAGRLEVGNLSTQRSEAPGSASTQIQGWQQVNLASLGVNEPGNQICLGRIPFADERLLAATRVLAATDEHQLQSRPSHQLGQLDLLLHTDAEVSLPPQRSLAGYQAVQAVQRVTIDAYASRLGCTLRCYTAGRSRHLYVCSSRSIACLLR